MSPRLRFHLWCESMSFRLRRFVCRLHGEHKWARRMRDFVCARCFTCRPCDDLDTNAEYAKQMAR